MWLIFTIELSALTRKSIEVEKYLLCRINAFFIIRLQTCWYSFVYIFEDVLYVHRNFKICLPMFPMPAISNWLFLKFTQLKCFCIFSHRMGWRVAHTFQFENLWSNWILFKLFWLLVHFHWYYGYYKDIQGYGGDIVLVLALV